MIPLKRQRSSTSKDDGDSNEAKEKENSKKSKTSSKASLYFGFFCIVLGMPCMWFKTKGILLELIRSNELLSKFNINYVNISNVQEDWNNNILTRKINKKIKEIDINPSSNESINQIIEKSNDNYTNLIYITLLVILGIIYFYI